MVFKLQGNQLIIRLSSKQAQLLQENPLLEDSFTKMLEVAIKDFFKEF